MGCIKNVLRILLFTCFFIKTGLGFGQTSSISGLNNSIATVDSDGDDYYDSDDLDDDNDGILDTVEDVNYEAYWAFDGSTNDVSGNDHNLISVFPSSKSPVYDSEGGSVSFDGTYLLRYSEKEENSSITGGFLNKEITNFSYSFWINPSSLTGTQTLVDEGGYTTGVTIRLEEADKLGEAELKVAVRNNGINSAEDLDGILFSIPSTGIWYHIGFTYENGNVTLYLNGVASETKDTGFGALVNHGNFSGFGATYRTDVFDNSGKNGSNYYSGLMDEFLYYEKSLSACEMSRLFDKDQVADSDCDGIINSLDNDSDNDGCPDALEGDYGVLISQVDANGRIDFTATGGISATGIPTLVNSGQADVSSTDNSVLGSECTTFSFEGTSNDYVSLGGNFNFTGPFTIEAWVFKSSTSTSAGIICSKGDQAISPSIGYYFLLYGKTPKFYWYDNSEDAIINLESNHSINYDTWYHIAVTFDGTDARLYVDGLEVANDTYSGVLPTITESFIIGALYNSNNPTTPSFNFNGYIDEVRIWDLALAEDQLHEMMNQRIEENTTTNNVKGLIIPLDISGSLPWSSLVGYYPFNEVDSAVDQSENNINGAVYNMTSNQPKTAPLPYKTMNTSDANWGSSTTWLNGDVQTIPNSVGIDNTTVVDWNIVNIVNTGAAVNTNRGDGHGVKLLGLISDVDSQLNVTGSTGTDGTGTGECLTISHYLKLNGAIDLEGESQLIQKEGSVLEESSTGYLERDQQGTANLYSYNYWGSPVGTTKFSGDVGISDYSYALENVLYDGANPVIFVGGYDGGTSPLRVANYWLYKYVDGSGAYAEWKSVGSTNPIYAGEGFSMKGTSAGDVSTFQNYSFRGKPNNGNISLTVSKDNQYLVANPYPSAINAFQFIPDNASSLMDGTLYFWQQYQGTSHNLADYEGGYATLTLAGGVPANTPAAGINPNLPTLENLKTPGQYIPVAQGFFTKSDADGGNIIFNNNQRIFVKESEVDAMGGSISIFMKDSNSKSKTSVVEKGDVRPKFRIGFEAPQVGHRQLLLTIDENSTDGVDWGYEGKMNGELKDDLFWNLLDDDKYVIQALPDANIDREIPLGIVMGETGIATIKIDALENIDEDVELFIKDKATLRFYKINEQPFEIELEAGEYLDRFLLVFKPSEKTEVVKVIEEEEEVVESGIYVNMDNTTSELNIRNTTHSELIEIELFNSLGQSLNTWSENLDNSINVLPVHNTATGMYIVLIQTTTGTISKKVIIE